MEKTQAKPLTVAQQRQRDKKRRIWLRTGVQLFFFVSMPGAFVAGFSGVKQIFLHIGAGEVLTADSFTLSLLGLCGFTLLFDRFFCGYACAFGSLGDAVWALSGLIQKKLFHRKKPLRLPERAVLWGQKVKYLLLAGLVALYVTRQEKLLTGASPWEVFFPPDSSASAAGGLRRGHCAVCAHFAGHGSAASVLLSVPLPYGSGVRPAAGAALCAAAPAERWLHPGVQCLQAAVPGVPEAGGKQPAQRGMHRL